MDATALYTTRGSSYEHARPGYPSGMIDYLYHELHFSEAEVIADIGSGTGKFTQLLLERGSRVYAVEPNAEMRRIAEHKLSRYPGFLSVDGTASHTGIEEPVDVVTAAQAFHWFDRAAFKKECRRLLGYDSRKNTGRMQSGTVCLIWNLRVPDSDVTCACREIFRRYCPRFVEFNIGMKEDAPEIYEFFGGRCDKASFDNPLRYDEDQFVERYLSSSYSLREGETDYEQCIRSVRDIFHRYGRDGEIIVPNRAICYSGTIAY